MEQAFFRARTSHPPTSSLESIVGVAFGVYLCVSQRGIYRVFTRPFQSPPNAPLNRDQLRRLTC